MGDLWWRHVWEGFQTIKLHVFRSLSHMPMTYARTYGRVLLFLHTSDTFSPPQRFVELTHILRQPPRSSPKPGHFLSRVHSLTFVSTSLTLHTGYASFRIVSFLQRLKEAFNSHRSHLQRRNNSDSPRCVVLRQCHAYERKRTEGYPS
jgi:hypothetical protein